MLRKLPTTTTTSPAQGDLYNHKNNQKVIYFILFNAVIACDNHLWMSKNALVYKHMSFANIF